jgi:hypothetical protein
MGRTPLTKSEISRFNTLLLPYVSHQAPYTLNDAMGDAIGFWKFSQKSASSYQRRGEQLHDVLALLKGKKNVDLQMVLDALLEAKQKAVRSFLNGEQIDRRRDFDADRKRVLAGLKNARRFLLDCGDDNADLAKLLATVEAHKWPGPHRRSRAGHQPEPWLKEARLKLRQARVPKESREELLEAVGLINSQF